MIITAIIMLLALTEHVLSIINNIPRKIWANENLIEIINFYIQNTHEFIIKHGNFFYF